MPSCSDCKFYSSPTGNPIDSDCYRQDEVMERYGEEDFVEFLGRPDEPHQCAFFVPKGPSAAKTKEMVKESLDNKAKGVSAVLDKMAANAWVVKFGDKEYRFSDEFTARKTYDDAVAEHQSDPDMYVALYDPSGVLILDEGEISKANKEVDKPAAPAADKPAAKDVKTPAKPAQKAPPSKTDVDKAYVKEMPAWAQVDELLDEKGATSVDPVLARAEVEQLKIDREQFEEGTPEYEAATKKIDFATRKLMASVNNAQVRKTAELKEDISKRLDEFHDKLQKGKVEAELTDAERAELAAKKEAELRERERNLDKKT